MRLDEESGTATEDEEDVRARELRKQEVWLKVPPRESDTETGSETEVKKSSKDTLSPLSENPSAASDKLSVEAIMGNEVDLDNKEPSETTIEKVLDYNPSNQHEGIGINSLISDETSQLILVTLCADKNNSIADNARSSCDSSRSKDCSNGRDSASRLKMKSHRGKSLTDDLNSYVDKCERKSSLPDLTIQRDNDQNNTNDLKTPVNINDDNYAKEIKSNLPDLIASSPGVSRKQSASMTDQSFDDNFIDANDDFFEASNELVTSNQLTDARDDKMTVVNKNIDHQTDSMTNDSKKNISDNQTTLDSFDILKQELKLRRNKKNINLTPLRPLSRETARSKMNQYFDVLKNDQLNNKMIKDFKNEQANDLEIKSHVSSKVNSKDLQKYFKNNSIDITNDALNYKKSESVDDIDDLDTFASQLLSESEILESPVVVSDKIPIKNIQENNLPITKKSNDEKSFEAVQQLSVSENKIELPKKIITNDDNDLPKIPERKRASKYLRSSLVNNNDHKNNQLAIEGSSKIKKEVDSEISKSSLGRKVETCESNKPVASLKFNKINKKQSRNEQDNNNKKDKCVIS